MTIPTGVTDPKTIAVALAIKQSIETSYSPGLSVNVHPNAFFLNVIGAVDLFRAAEFAIARYKEALAKEAETAAKAALAATDAHLL